LKLLDFRPISLIICMNKDFRPISPFLFFIVIEGLNVMLCDSIFFCYGVGAYSNYHMSHLQLANDTLIV